MTEAKNIAKKRRLNDNTAVAIRKVWSDDPVLQEFAEWVIENGGYMADCLSIQRGACFPCDKHVCSIQQHDPISQ